MAELFKVNAPVRKPLFEGVQGENEARSIQFDIEPWVTELGDGAVTATAKRSQDSQPYPVTVTKDGNIVTWKPTSTDTAYAGVGSFQLEYTVDSVLAKTCIWSTMVAPSLDPAGDPPDPYDNWLAEMREIAADAIQAAQDAEQAVEDAQDEVENAEAWAVGQRGGVDVPSTDPAYENNAKYWAGQAEDLKDATQAIVDEARADVFEAMDGLHEETTAGSALQLISDKYTENKEPYLFRKSGGGKSIGNREIDTLVGGSVAWNQLQKELNATNWESESGVTSSFSDGVATVSSTSAYNGIIGRGKTLVNGHKYLISADLKSSENINVAYGFQSESGVIAVANPTSTWGKYASIKSAVRDYNANGLACVYAQTAYTNLQVRNCICFDLTQMFSTAVADRLYAMEQANAGSGVALFRSWFPKDYYEYNTGTLMSVKTSAHEMVGFNQWDEEWESGDINVSNGEKRANGNRIRSKNFIPVVPNTAYYFNSASAGGSFVACFYDENKNWVSSSEGTGWDDLPSTKILTTPSWCRYLMFYQNGTTYNHDICVNISSDRNGEYQPYVKHTYPLDDIELRGVPKLDGTDIYFDGDTYEADGAVTRKYDIVDLGTLNYTLESTSETRQVFKTTITSARTTSSATEPFAGMSTKFVAKTINDSWVAGDMAWRRTGAPDIALVTKSGEYASAAAFKTAMSGVYLVYELATPTTETADPFTSPQIVDAYGTERYVDERTVAVPVGHVTKYPDNLREKLDGLPWDFSTLIAPTEKTYTATRNYTAGSLLIVGNVLYKVTANIANGGTITPNTNCTATTLAEVISAL